MPVILAAGEIVSQSTLTYIDLSNKIQRSEAINVVMDLLHLMEH